MPVTIKLPTPLRRFTNQQKLVTLTATTVGEALDQLVGQYPDMRGIIFDESGAVKSFVRVFVGEQDIEALEGLATAVAEGVVVSIFPPIAGA